MANIIRCSCGSKDMDLKYVPAKESGFKIFVFDCLDCGARSTEEEVHRRGHSRPENVPEPPCNQSEGGRRKIMSESGQTP